MAITTGTPRGYKVSLEYPRDRSEGEFWDRFAMFAARGDRSVKSRDALWEEVNAASPYKVEQFVGNVMVQDWALDVGEMNIFLWHIEGVPSFLVKEWLRHRLIARDWSFQELSKRTIHAYRLEVINPFDKVVEPFRWLIFEDAVVGVQHAMKQLHDDGVSAERLRYLALEGTKTRLTAGSNARALHHFFTMRGSVDIGANGRAYPEFQEIVGTMYSQAREMCPVLFKEVLKS